VKSEKIMDDDDDDDDALLMRLMMWHMKNLVNMIKTD